MMVPVSERDDAVTRTDASSRACEYVRFLFFATYDTIILQRRY